MLWLTTGDIEKTVVFRLNPDRFVDENGRVLEANQIFNEEDGSIATVEIDEARAWRFQQVEEDVRHCLEGPWESEHFIHVFYWFFNGPMRREGFVPVDGDEYRRWVSQVQAMGEA